MEHGPTLRLPTVDHPSAPVVPARNCTELELADPHVEPYRSAFIGPSATPLPRRLPALRGERPVSVRPAAQGAGLDSHCPVAPLPVRQPDHVPGWPRDAVEALGCSPRGDHASDRHTWSGVAITARPDRLQHGAEHRLYGPGRHGPGIA